MLIVPNHKKILISFEEQSGVSCANCSACTCSNCTCSGNCNIALIQLLQA